MTHKKYKIVYADPPWELKYLKETKAGINVYDLPYPQMTDDEIMQLPIKDIVDDDAILFMWCIDSRIPKIKQIMESWGFTYKTVGFVWNKESKHTGGVNANLGKYTRKSCEFCFIGTRGRCIVENHTQNQYWGEPKREHSRKPDVFRNLIVNMCGDVPRIELFARQRFQGWDLYGNEAPNHTQMLLHNICPKGEFNKDLETTPTASSKSKSEILTSLNPDIMFNSKINHRRNKK